MAEKNKRSERRGVKRRRRGQRGSVESISGRRHLEIERRVKFRA